jgi:hypothetical protein
MGRISKGDANHLPALDRGRAVISWRGQSQRPVSALANTGPGRDEQDRMDVRHVVHFRWHGLASIRSPVTHEGQQGSLRRQPGGICGTKSTAMTGRVDQLMGLWEQGSIARIFRFDDAAAPTIFIQDHKNIGKVLLTPRPEPTR